MKEIKYVVDVGGGAAYGTVFVDKDATDDDVRLAIMNDLYSVDYWEIKDGEA